MSLIPNIKTKLTGNKGAAQGFIKFATSQLAILERQMSFQNLNEGRRIVSPIKGVTIECISRFGKKEVKVHVDDITVSVSPSVPTYDEVINVSEEILPIKDAIPLVAHTGAACAFGLLNISNITTNPFIFWSPLSAGGVNADYSFLQVRYLKEIALFDAGIYPDIEKEIIFSLKIARSGGRDFIDPQVFNYTTTYTIQITGFEEFGEEEIQQIDLPFEIDVSKKVSLSPLHDVHLFALELSLVSGSDTYNVTANFNADRTKLYVVAWGSGIDNLYPTVSEDIDPAATSSGTVYIYERSLVADVITWTLSFTDTIIVPYFMAGAFIDTSGVLSGLYEITLPPDSTEPPFCVELDYYGTRVDGNDYNVQFIDPVISCATFDLEAYSQGAALLDSITVSGTTTSIGTTITNGDFAPVEMNISNSCKVPFIEGMGNGPDPAFDQSGYCAPFDVYCNTEGHPICLAHNIPYRIFYVAEIENGYVSSVLPANSSDNTYWHSYFFVNTYGSPQGHTNSVGILGMTYANTSIFHGNGTGIFDSNAANETYDLYLTEENPVLVRTMFGGIIWDEGERIADYHAEGTGWPFVSEVPWNSAYITNLSVTDPSIKYPLMINNAEGLNGFISHDQNPTDFYSALEIIGVMYTDLSDSDIVKNKITINEIVMSDEALVDTGIATGGIHSIGFIC